MQAEYYFGSEVINKDETRELIRLMEVRMMRATTMFGDDSLQNNNFKYLKTSVDSNHLAGINQTIEILSFYRYCR